MKHLKILLFAVLTLFAASACSQNNPQKTMEKKKVLVVFFSATGTTKQVAVNLAKIVDADICEIIPLQPYTSADLDWHNSHSRSSVEMNNSESRPDIKPIELDLKNYDAIFLGYPIWWDLAPRVVNTFIESNDLTGKTVIPFATSGGSSIEGSIEALKKSYPDIKWRGGKLLNGESEKALKTWCNNLGISTL
ncbi:MAG: flavodoxin [Candidatus Limisoma sp.]|nr:flavodoxin [Muribaculaceae bacterium]